MVSRNAMLGAGAAVLVALVITIIYFANKPTFIQGCTPGAKACADEWVDASGNKMDNVQQVCDGSGNLVGPIVGPGKCTDPCPKGQIGCWSAGENMGRCYVGKACPPCFTSADCGGVKQGACNVPTGSIGGTCQCKASYFGINCQATDCKSGDVCGPNATCSADGKSCVCKQGWADSPQYGPCSVCANDVANNNAWGPPGVCTWRRYVMAQDKNGAWGAALPLATTAANCADNSDFDGACHAEFGGQAYWPGPPNHPDSGPAPDAFKYYYCEDDGETPPFGPNACWASKLGGGEQAICWVPGGYYGLPGNDPKDYKVCNAGADGKAAKPPGYIKAAGL